jgi:hypothetical protein
MAAYYLQFTSKSLFGCHLEPALVLAAAEQVVELNNPETEVVGQVQGPHARTHQVLLLLYADLHEPHHPILDDVHAVLEVFLRNRLVSLLADVYQGTWVDYRYPSYLADQFLHKAHGFYVNVGLLVERLDYL